jgi:hypothetical protein
MTMLIAQPQTEVDFACGVRSGQVSEGRIGKPDIQTDELRVVE